MKIGNKKTRGETLKNARSNDQQPREPYCECVHRREKEKELYLKDFQPKDAGTRGLMKNGVIGKRGQWEYCPQFRYQRVKRRNLMHIKADSRQRRKNI